MSLPQHLPQHLTYSEVITACQRAFDNGTLLARAKELGNDDALANQFACRYTVGPLRCAIGAALNEDALVALDNEPGLQPMLLDVLVLEHIVSTAEEDDDEGTNHDKLAQLQRLHDAWMTGSKQARTAFLRLIDREGA